MRALIPAIALACLFAVTARLQAQVRVVSGGVTDSTGSALSDVSIDVAGTFWRATSLTDGSFIIRAPAHSAVVRARRIGFQPESVTVEASARSVTFVLRSQPVRLQGIKVVGDRASSMETSVTPETVRKVPPLGEPDIFRAIALLPAISQPNDLKGRIHLAGGASDETGVELDGHPLQEPFHMLGVLGSFNLAALDRADVFLHHVPVDRGGRMSGLVSLHTRKPPRPVREIVVSLLSAGFTVAQPATIGGLNLLVSGRLTYLDRLLRALGDRARINGDEPTIIGYRDAMVTADRSWGRTMLELDYFKSWDYRPTGGDRAYDWGETLGGARLTRNAGSWLLKSRVSFNRASSTLTSSAASPFRQVVDLRHDLLSAAVDARYASERSSMLFGLETNTRTNNQYWTNAPDDFFSPHAPRNFAGADHQERYTALSEVARRFGESTVTGGVRATRVAGRVFAEPRLLLNRRLGEDHQLHIAFDRRLQFETQLEEPLEGTGKQPLFLLDEPRVVDIAAMSLRRARTASQEWEVGTFYKKYRKRTSLRADTAAVPAVNSPPPEFDRIPGFAYGATATWFQRPTARTLIQASYTFQIVKEKLDTVYTPADWDAPHTLSVFGTAQLSRKWSLNMVSQWRSGAVATPVATLVFVPEHDLTGRLLPRYFPGPRNSARLPSYQRVDVGVRRESIHGRRQIAFTAQVINILARTNALEYDPASLYCSQTGCGEATPSRRGLPIIPSIGLELRW